MCCIIAFSWF
jgi:hypothetical protein